MSRASGTCRTTSRKVTISEALWRTFDTTGAFLVVVRSRMVCRSSEVGNLTFSLKKKRSSWASEGIGAFHLQRVLRRENEECSRADAGSRRR